MAFVDSNPPAWEFSNGVITRNSITGLKYISNEITGNPIVTSGQFNGLFKQDKNYQFITNVIGNGIIGTELHIKLSSPFLTTDINVTNPNINLSGAGVKFYTYANPVSTEQTNKIIQYGANEHFVYPIGIKESQVNEIDMLINGYRIFEDLNLGNPNAVSQPNGWCYKAAALGQPGSYTWYNSPSGIFPPFFSTYGSGIDNSSGVATPSNINYIAKEIQYDVFNLELDYQITNMGFVNAYIIKRSDLKNGTASWGTPFMVLDTTQKYTYVNLKGTNDDGSKNLLVFSADPTNFFNATLQNISIYGGYNNINNVQVLPSTQSTSILEVNIPNAEYQFQSVTNGLTYSLSSKLGNGYFKAGIWENGVWNNGWRDDTIVKDFDDVYSSILYAYDISWKIKISGSAESCNSFKVGDKVAIGNIIAIDINENRKLIRDYYTISATGSDGIGASMVNWIEVSLDTTFPYRRIEKDSPNHKIKITKNIWLSGAFFNGYFSGVWNNGLFKGYPKITEMFDTHWIDGFFNGGHFNSNYKNYYFSNITSTTNCNVNNITLEFGSIPYTEFPNGQIPIDYKVGHDLLPGDYITIEKYKTLVNGSFTLYNESYNGIVKVLSVSGSNIVVDKKLGTLIEYSDGTLVPQVGKVTKYMASGLIQNFKFYDTNRSKIKSSDSPISTSVFSFNSWIDVNYDYTRSVSLGRDFKTYEPLSGKSINRNNLYGYPTYDVLSSAARFRNSFDLNYGLYRLGTKYKLFNDFIGDASGFNDPFDPTLPNISNFYGAGWTFSYKNGDISFNRSDAVISTNNASIFSTSIQDYIDAGVTGNELYLTATNSGGILNNNKINTNKSRYTIIEFDVVTYSIADSKFTQVNQNPYNLLVVGPNGVTSPAATQSGTITNTGTLTASNIFSFDNSLNPGSFDFKDGFNGEVWSVDKQSDGKVIVSGNFTTYNGVSTPMAKLCRINLDGSIDSSFSPVINDINDTNIKFIKVFVVKKYYSFIDQIFLIINYSIAVTVNSHTPVIGRLVHLKSDGTNDTTTLIKRQMEFNGEVTDVSVRPSDGLIVVVGNFTQYYLGSSVTYFNKMAMFDATGYSAFNGQSQTPNSNKFFGVNDIPSTIDFLNDIGVQGNTNNSIIIGGKISKFSVAYPTSNSNTFNTYNYVLNGIVKLKTSHNYQDYIDVNSFASNPQITASSPNSKGFTYPSSPTILPNSSYNFINKIIIDSSNKVYVVGNFTNYNDGAPHACFNIARLTATGSYDSSFNSGQGLNSYGYDMDLSSDYSKIYVGGQFTKYNGIDCGKVISINNTGVLNSNIGALNPLTTSVVKTLILNGSNLIVGGLFANYQLGVSTTTSKTITTSDYIQSESISYTDIINLAVNINLDCTGSDLGNITINLKSPAGKVINLKNSNGINNPPLSLNAQTKLTNTIFDISSNTLLSTGNSPYTGTFAMEKLPNKGTLGFLSDTITSISDLFTTSNSNATGTWTIYIQNDTSAFPTLISWNLIITYKSYINDPSIYIAPSVDLPILHFNNLNYEIGTQPTGIGQVNSQVNLIYKKMSYLPVTQNINHLLVKNSFRFDSVEKTSPERYNGFGTNTIKKKYEYFYNKTDLMMSIQGNGSFGTSQSMLVLDNIKMYETDMIPFFKYFEDANIYKGIQVPYQGLAPNIDYLNSDFVFIDNITIGLDSINSTILDNAIVCIPNNVLIAQTSTASLTTGPVSIPNTYPLSQTSANIEGSITLYGNLQFITGGIYLSTTDPGTNPSATNTSHNVPFTGSFNLNFTGLTQNTTYWAYTYVIYSSVLNTTEITQYGPVVSFTTGATPPDYSSDYSSDYSV